MPPAARKADKHSCPIPAHSDGPILPPCCETVLIGNLPAARIGDKADCVIGTDTIVEGSPTVLIGNERAARIGDATNHGGAIVTGEPTVLIGDVGMGKPNRCMSNAKKTGAPFVKPPGNQV